MSKSILLIDTPKDGSCFECKVVNSCKVNPKYIHSVPKEVCPLQDVTPLLKALETWYNNSTFDIELQYRDNRISKLIYESNIKSVKRDYNKLRNALGGTK